ncbi:MAG: hypothetical protein PVSMB7_19600 [Chloroflexota bacterium]
MTDAIIATYQDAVTRDDSSYRTAVLAQINSAIKDKEGVMDLLQSLKTEFHVSRGHNVYWLPFHSLTFAARHLDIAATTAVTDPQAENAASEFGAAQKSMKHTWTPARSLQHPRRGFLPSREAPPRCTMCDAGSGGCVRWLHAASRYVALRQGTVVECLLPGQGTLRFHNLWGVVTHRGIHGV